MALLERFLLKYWKHIEIKDRQRMSKQIEPKKIKVISNIPYIKNATTSNYLDIYYPLGTIEPLPVIIVVHGGGWLYGNKELNRNYAMNLAARGFSVVNINYHLVQEKRFPRQLKDINLVLKWIEENNNDYYLDTDNVFITGDSAGAHLASIAMALQYNNEISERLGLCETIKIKAGGLICGVYDFSKFNPLIRFFMKPYAQIMLGENLKKSQNTQILSFMNIFNGQIPPLYIMSSKQDFISSQTFNLIDFLKQNNVFYKFRFWDKGLENKLTHVFNVLYPNYKESIITNNEMCQFFKDQLQK